MPLVATREIFLLGWWRQQVWCRRCVGQTILHIPYFMCFNLLYYDVGLGSRQRNGAPAMEFSKRYLISLTLEGPTNSHELQKCSPGNFCDDSHYPISLFNLVLNLFAIPLNHTGFSPIRLALHQQWERTLMLLQPSSSSDFTRKNAKVERRRTIPTNGSNLIGNLAILQ